MAVGNSVKQKLCIDGQGEVTIKLAGVVGYGGESASYAKNEDADRLLWAIPLTGSFWWNDG
jgi:hypothetical protein